MRLFSKYYENCSPEIFEKGRRFILSARRKGCPRSFFSHMNQSDSRSVRKIERFGQNAFDRLFLLDIISAVSNWAMIRALIISIDESDKKSSSRSSSSLLIFIHNQLSAIRLLVVNELDTQARAACRPLREATDLLVLTQSDTELAASFVAAQDPKKANEFWRKNVSRDRAKKRQIRMVYSRSFEGERIGDEVLSYINEEEAFLTQAIHPSYLAGVMPILSIVEPGENGEWRFLSKSVSIRTLSFSCFICTATLLHYLSNSEMPDDIPQEKIIFIGDNDKKIKETMMMLLIYVASALVHIQSMDEQRTEESGKDRRSGDE